MSETKQVGEMSAEELGAYVKALKAGHAAKLKYLNALLKAQRVMEGLDPDGPGDE